MRRLALILLVGAACQGRAPDVEATAAWCANLDVAAAVSALQQDSALLRSVGYRGSAEIEAVPHQVRSPDADRLVVTMSWGGPSSGAVVVANCAGESLGARQLGYVRNAELIQRPAMPERLLVTYIAGTGTGWTKEDAALLGFQGDSVTVLWSGTTQERSYQAPDVGAYELQGSVQLVSSDTLVHSVERVELQHDEAADEWRPLESTRTRVTERYVWVPVNGRFELVG